MARIVDKRKIFVSIAKELGVSVRDVESAVDSQFRYVKRIFKSDTFAQVRLPYFGRFWVKPGRLKFLQRFGKRFPNEPDTQNDAPTDFT